MSAHNNTGLFIVLEGIDNVGKSSQIKLVAESLRSKGHDVLTTREPGGTGCTGAEEIRNLVVNGDKDRWDGLTELLLFSAARRSHVETLIKPALAEGKIVLCDRFVPSTIAYQGYGQGINLDIIHSITDVAIGDFKPSLLVILTVDPEEALRRFRKRGGTEIRYESMDLEFQDRVNLGYEEISESTIFGICRYAHNINVLDTTQNEFESSDECIARITETLLGYIQDYL